MTGVQTCALPIWLTELRADNPAWNIEHIEIKAVPWYAYREPSTSWIGGHPVVEAQFPGALGRLMTQAVDLAALVPGAATMPYAERMEHLTFLRRQFPGWAFKLCDSRPYWYGRRSHDDYAGRAAAVTEVRGNDPNEMALLLMRIPRAEAGVDDVQDDAAEDGSEDER